MALRLQDWLTDLLGLQSILPAQFGAQQVGLQTSEQIAVECSTFLSPKPIEYESVSLAVVRENLAVIPADWNSNGISKPWFSARSHSSFDTCMDDFRDTSFIAFHQDFLVLIGQNAKLETIHEFSGVDADHVHEAPVYVSATNELVFADTSVIGWLWALKIDTHQIRKIKTSPPLENVNGATPRDSRIYLTTNGGRAPGVWNCTMPTGYVEFSDSDATTDVETITCEPVVNNYRLLHLNSPNDLIFTQAGHILFTDPLYGWFQSWPGVGPPELPTATYHFNTHTRALTPLDHSVLQPNGLVLSADQKTLYIADSNSISGKPARVWADSVRNVYAFDFDESSLQLTNRRLVHMVEKGWPDGLRVTKLGDRELVLVASMGGVDVVDVSGGGAGVLLGKWNVGDDTIFNLEPVGRVVAGKRYTPDTWLLTGHKGVYKVSIASQ